MNILLVYPKYPNTFWSFKYALKFVARKAAYPPLGLLTIGAMLPREWNKKLIDLNIRDLKDDDIKSADMVFISAMIVQKESAQEIINRCNTLETKVVAGGPVFSTGSEKFKGVDHFVLDEAEITLPLFLEDLKQGKAKSIYTSKEKPDITETPAPLWSLIKLKDYASMAIQYSRGCPFNCEFCDIIIMNGRVPRTKTPKQLIQELQLLYDAGWRGSLFIVDDNFIGNKAKVKEMLPYLYKWQEEHKFPFTLFTEASINLADDQELMQMMSKANFSKIFLGLETPNVESLNECNKVQNSNRDLAHAVKIIHENGLQVMAGFIVGFDNDTESIFEAQIKFIQQIGVVTAMVGVLSALPHTQLWHRLKSEGRLLHDWTGQNNDGTLNFVPKMGKEKLMRGYQEIITTIYSSKNYYKRIDTFIKSYKATAKAKLTRQDLRAFLRSTWAIGIISRSRLRYWKLLIKTAVLKKKALPVAIELAIFGQHFLKIARKMKRT